MNGEDTLQAEVTLSGVLVHGYPEEEEDLFFELAMGEEARSTLRRIARKRMIKSWASAEAGLIKNLNAAIQ